jgi:hypothetical protein
MYHHDLEEIGLELLWADKSLAWRMRQEIFNAVEEIRKV